LKLYVIWDVWTAIRLASLNFFWAGLVWAIVCFALNLWGWFIIGMSLIFAQSILIYFANRLYVVDVKRMVFNFPRSDLENSILAIITLRPYWNLMFRKTVQLTEVENIYLDTKRWTTVRAMSNGNDAQGRPKIKKESKKHIRYCLNIAGAFGSANLSFLSRQKRDEVRNALEQSIKQLSGRPVDLKVAELS
jgi:hypothetical protein